MDAATVDALMSENGRALLDSLPPYDEKAAVALTSRLRAEGHSPELVAAALTQSRLRARAITKFGAQARHMLFTPDALEQATRAPVAALHAARLKEAGATCVVDGGCGIGADAVGFANAGLDVIAVEADPATALMARHNLALHPSSRVETAQLEDIALTLHDDMPNAAWWFDPARRLPGVADIHGRTKRTFSLAALSPTWSLVQEIASTAPMAGVKLSPSLTHSDIPPGCEAEFVSYAGDVVEAAVWWGDAARDVGTSATIMRPPRAGDHDAVNDATVESLHVTPADAQGADESPATRADLGEYFYEADKALTRSGLVGALLATTGGREFTPGYGYITADSLTSIGLLGRAYRVLDAVPLRPKTLRAYLRERSVGRVTIKKRDVDLDADALRRQLKLKGSEATTIVLVTLDGERTALVVESA